MLRLLSILMPAIVTLFIPSEASSIGAALPRYLMMGVMGDSISAASFSDVPIPDHGQTAEEQTKAWAARELEPKAIFENKSTLSWASGAFIDSHFMKLRRALRRSGEKRQLIVENVAFPGNESVHMEAQANELVAAFKKNRYSMVKYITILIGSNDACDGNPLDEVRKNLIAAFRKLSEIKQSEPIRILVVGIPRIPELAEPAFREHKTLLGLTCHEIRNKVLHFCDSLLTWQTEAEYDQKMMVIEDMNRLLRSIVREANREFPELEVVYSDRLYNLNIPVEVMAADCFHPAKLGQEALARETWLDQPWFN